MKIAIQGIKGSFHHQAVQRMLGKDDIEKDDIELVECLNFKEVFGSVKNDLSSFGLVAIENNIHGSINEVYRLLQKNDVWIVKDLRLHISQNLIAHKDLRLNDLTKRNDIKILSHNVALAQTDYWLSENLPNAIRQEHSDTAGSVKHVMESKQDNTLAIASEFAAKTYDAKIIADNIQDNDRNYTRFILFQKDKKQDGNTTHCSIILTTDHKPGALLQCLKIFSNYNCNLTKLDSQPIPGDDQHYSFYIDYEIPVENQELLNRLRENGCNLKVLGEYSTVD